MLQKLTRIIVIGDFLIVYIFTILKIDLINIKIYKKKTVLKKNSTIFEIYLKWILYSVLNHI